ncbi:enterochelin esterase [Leifsonia sp. 98AMF]|uniref:alpha/beta hydrolase n=1 Tax=unclassified Leifsonia TaxID=2663824 RepID=UPI00087DD9C4|nr:MULTISPECIES: alpha/beta hydrolase-fold protein [unclassified Leifsonia]SDH35081.1 enterochelin esterase [Leifsonia sp. 197AMF]SDJ00484.1 enterochelin esterase [Leifsonia sp. 466MF]SDJ73718.1 enterochelin esterase [Leifsonia sp. 157MF]SDO03810.1 enterochelin esterase [Leifsonia sp. 509MF]SEN00157.1 enterochelin esterase [Leifsonia sp. 467MF]
MTTDVPFHPLPIDQADVHYVPGPDSAPQEGVPAGVTTRFELESSIRFPGTSRTVWVHVPPGVDAGSPARVMVFNDGWWYLDPDGDVRGGVVLDNLIHQGAIPPMIGVFVDPGVLADGQKNRNREYDAFDARYADFLVDDVLAAVGERHVLSQRAADRGICGGSSGGNAAFTAAWMRPDQFGRVIAFNASFAQMPGGNPYPALLGTEPTRATRILLHAAHRDLGWNQRTGNWFAENLRTAAALAEAGYDMRLVLGDGGHSANHGGVLLPDALRWLWRAVDRPAEATR